VSSSLTIDSASSDRLSPELERLERKNNHSCVLTIYELIPGGNLPKRLPQSRCTKASEVVVMLDALKFAFEILVVGVLALPWLAILNRMFRFHISSDSDFGLSPLPESVRGAVVVAFVVAAGYLLGSAVSRFSRDFFNDELWKPLPTEDMIRDNVYYEEFCSEHAFVYQYWSRPIHLEPPPDFCLDKDTKAKLLKTNPGKLVKFNDLGTDQLNYFDLEVQEVFLLEESELLLQGLDKVDRLKQYYDQITVLRGGAFNGFILFLLCVFGSCGTLREHWSGHPILRNVTFLPAAAVAVFALYKSWAHFQNATASRYSDPPLAELVILLLAGVGFFATSNAEKGMSYFRICILASIVTAISFGGWWWTEVMYDLQVIHSLPQLKPTATQEDAIGQPKGAPSTKPTSSPLSSTPNYP
jgi:hypothetical protein